MLYSNQFNRVLVAQIITNLFLYPLSASDLIAAKLYSMDECDAGLTINPSSSVEISPTDKALPVITEDEVGRIIDLGLGRGVDATDASPWLHKSSFQVRRIHIDNIIGTEEGGSMQSYEREVSSVTTQQTDLKASVAIPQAPINLGLEGEQSRSVSTTRKAIGKRVMNRTISFATQFDDLSQSESSSNFSAQKDSMACKSVYTKEQSIEEFQQAYTFEEQLSKWILDRVLHRYELAQTMEDMEIPPEIAAIKGINPRQDISNYINAVDHEGAKQIVSDCADFVQHFRITHYVNSISLGAAQYRIISETEYFNKVSAKGSFGFEAIASLAITESFLKKTIHRASNVRKIGRIIDEKVARGSYSEAVIGIGILPIHQLVQLRFLHLALRKALLEYIDVKGDTSCKLFINVCLLLIMLTKSFLLAAGPFLIKCEESEIYWKVNDANGFAIEGTRQPSQASLFLVIPNDDGDHPYEFLIGWQKDHKPALLHSDSTIFQSEERKGARMFRYLNAHVNILGQNSGPLCLSNNIHEEDARFALHNRLLRKHVAPVDLREWVSGKDQFFINCSRRKRSKNGFLAIKRVVQREEGQVEYTSVCVPSVKHNNEVDTFMLFSLVSPKAKEDAKKHKELVLDDELDQFFQASSSKSNPRFRSVSNLGKRLANAVANTASSAMSHTASAVTSIVGHHHAIADKSTEMKKSTPDFRKTVAIDAEETTFIDQ